MIEDYEVEYAWEQWRQAQSRANQALEQAIVLQTKFQNQESGEEAARQDAEE